MKIEYNIQDLYRIFFGYAGLPFPGTFTPYTGDYSGKEFDTVAINELTNRRYQRSNVLGKPFFLPVELGGVWLPNDPIMTVNVQKRIVCTPVTGRAGTVKELIGCEDHKIRIRGIAVNYESNDYPEDEISALIELSQRNEVLTIKSLVTDLFDVHNVVIESFQLPENQGRQNVQPYELSLLSDDDFTAVLETSPVTAPLPKQVSRIYAG